MKDASQQDALSNLEELIKQKRFNLKEGQVMPIAYKVEVYRRKDGNIVFKSGYITSKPVARWGRDWNNQNSAYGGMWKLTSEAELNFQEFIRKSNFNDRVNLLRGKREEQYID